MDDVQTYRCIGCDKRVRRRTSPPGWRQRPDGWLCATCRDEHLRAYRRHGRAACDDGCYAWH